MTNIMKIAKGILPALLYFPLLHWVGGGCNPIPQTMSAPTPTSVPTVIPSALPMLSPTLETTPDTGWQGLQPGLERRLIRIYNDQSQHIESLYMFRLEQSQFRLDVAYHESPQSLESWKAETNALLVVNGGYFRVENENHIPNGLTIVDGEAFGNSYEPFAGMLAIREQGAELRWLAEKPYDPNEPLMAGLQSFPVLVKPGGVLGFPEQNEDNVRARRTVIGQDQEGRLLFIVAPRGYFTLHLLSLYLTASDLNLDIAINLDGGPSTGFLVANPPEIIPSQTLLPIVILVNVR